MCNLTVIRLPRDSINKLVCAECKDYLRIGPIKTTLSGESVCGKCSVNTKFASAITAKNLTELLSVVTFPCKYEDYGCTEYFPFNDTSKHEEKCVYRSYCCPADFLMCGWLGTMSQILQHYRECHQNETMSEPIFEIRTGESIEETRLYMLEQFGFLVKTKISIEEDKLWINLEYIGKEDIAKEIRYKLIFHDEDIDGLQVILKERNPTVLSHQPLYDLNNFNSVSLNPLISVLKNPARLFCTLSIYVPRKVVGDMKEMLSKIKCLSCSVYMSLPIYQCPDGHNICLDCMSYNNKCKLCKEADVLFERNFELESISASLLLKCRWPKCKQSFGESHIRKHEQKCLYKHYKCPRCSKFYGQDEIIEHFTKEHGSYPLHSADVIVIQGDICVYDFFIMAFGEIFSCSLFRTDDNERNFAVWYYGLPRFHNDYRFLVEIRSPDNPLPIKTYELSKCSPSDDCYSFNLKIPIEDIARFESNFDFAFKITEKASV
ncbi:hypothetical protein Trydic_g10457 [Trypoxylus dichotomus]